MANFYQITYEQLTILLIFITAVIVSAAVFMRSGKKKPAIEEYRFIRPTSKPAIPPPINPASNFPTQNRNPPLNPVPAIPPQPVNVPANLQSQNIEPYVELASSLPEEARVRTFNCGYCGWDLTKKYYEAVTYTLEGQHAVIYCANCFRRVTPPIPVETRARKVISRNRLVYLGKKAEAVKTARELLVKKQENMKEAVEENSESKETIEGSESTENSGNSLKNNKRIIIQQPRPALEKNQIDPEIVKCKLCKYFFPHEEDGSVGECSIRHVDVSADNTICPEYMLELIYRKPMREILQLIATGE